MTDPIARLVAPLVKASWPNRATAERPSGPPTFNDVTGTYDRPHTTLATAMRCALVDTTMSRPVDVAGDLETQTRARFEHDPDVTLQVDDRISFTTHPSGSVTDGHWWVASVHPVDRATYGLAYLTRAEPDSGA